MMAIATVVARGARCIFAPCFTPQFYTTGMSKYINSVALIELEEAQAELDSFFGAAHAPPEHTPPDLSSPLLRSESPHWKNPEPSLSQHRDSLTACSQRTGLSQGLSHVDGEGNASMVDVAEKAATSRVACASAEVHIGEQAARLVRDNQIRKGNVLTSAQLAGIMGSKWTSTLLPLCHQVNISRSDVKVWVHEEQPIVHIESEVRCVGQTGVEMEALTAACVASLTVFDMCKAVSKDIVITDVRLEFKSGGKSGVYNRSAS